MVYNRSQRTTLKRRTTYGRGTRRYAQTRYRRAYFNKRRGVMRKEKKGCDVTFSNTPITASSGTNAGIWLLNGVQEGVGSWNRIGRYIWNKSIELDLSLDWITANTDSDSAQTVASWVRCTVVWDKQPNNGSIPTFDTIFGQTDQAGVESTSIMDHLRYDNMFRFKVLADHYVNPQIVNTTAGNNPATSGASIISDSLIRWHKYIKLGNRMTNYSGTANPITTANISTGALYLIIRSPITGDEYWSLRGNSTARLRYVD